MCVEDPFSQIRSHIKKVFLAYLAVDEILPKEAPEGIGVNGEQGLELKQLGNHEKYKVIHLKLAFEYKTDKLKLIPAKDHIS